MDEVLSLAKVICLVSCVYHTRDGPTCLTLSAYCTVSLALDQLFKAVVSIWRVMMSVENLDISYMVAYHLFFPPFCRHREDIATTGRGTGWASCVPSPWRWLSMTCSTEWERRGKHEHSFPQVTYIDSAWPTHPAQGWEMKYSHWLSLAKRMK